jgi:hypothetical protein
MSFIYLNEDHQQGAGECENGSSRVEGFGVDDCDHMYRSSPF